MQRLSTLWQVVSAATEMTRQEQIYRFNVENPTTVYLRAEGADVRLTRWDKPQVEAHIRLQMPMGWRIATDHDAAGVYLIAKRRPVLGGVASVSIGLVVPRTAYLVLHLDGGHLLMEHLSGVLHIPPPEAPPQPPKRLKD